MKPFSASLDDILFCLEAAGQASTLPDWDSTLAEEIGGHFAAFAEGEIAPLDEPGDVQGCRLEDGRVRMPDGFGAVYRSMCEQGWPALTAPEEFGGQGLGPLMLAITSEIFSGACHSLQMVTGLAPGAIRTLMRFGNDEQKNRFIPPLVSGEWLATMCLTEPGAGSDLSRIRCRAERDGDHWRITGEKIFISGGDQDMSDGIFHLVLARTSDDGLKGLSLFACAGDLADGTRNRISVTRIEEKMGLHASPTCQLAFDGASAELLGREGQGLTAMFTMMNHARADVSLQGVAHAARAHDIASSYAAERVQGRMADVSDAPLTGHADVRRMLDRMDALAMGGRALVHLTLVALERGDNPDLVEFLTPLIKAYCTDGGIEAANLGIQVLGGYGYLREYRVEQTLRDARITAIYEGANGIHERMQATRLLRTGSGEAFATFIRQEIERTGSAALATLLGLWNTARGHLLTVEDATPLANAFSRLTANVALEAVWLRMAAAADSHPDPQRIRRLAMLVFRENRLFSAALKDAVCEAD